MNKTVEERKAHVFKEITTILLLGISYYIFVTITGVGIPCVFRLITGYKCPGCGISHMFIKLFHLDFIGAFHENEFVFILLPIALLYGVYKSYMYIYKNDTRMRVLEVIVITLLLISAICFGIYRNISI